MLLPTNRLDSDSRRLLDLFKGLSEQDRGSLLAFAEFLRQRASQDVAQADVFQEKADIPRPKEETVIAAIKRLSATYPMLDRSMLLDQTSGLMSAHIMQGKEAEEVIDELEAMFEQYYLQHTSKDS